MIIMIPLKVYGQIVMTNLTNNLKWRLIARNNNQPLSKIAASRVIGGSPIALMLYLSLYDGN